MFLATAVDVPVATDLKILVLVIPVVAQIIKQIPPVKARADWLIPLIVLVLSVGLASVTLGTFALLEGLVLAVACLGVHGAAKIPGKLLQAPGGNEP